MIALALATFTASINAQSFDEPVKYIEFFNQEFSVMQDLQIEYSSFLVHTRSDVAENKRQKLLLETQKIHNKFQKVVAYADDKGIKENAIKILDAMLKIGNTEYSKIASEKVGCLDCFSCVIAEGELTDKDSKEMGKSMKAMLKSIESFAKVHEIGMTEDANNHETLLGKINRINSYIHQLGLATLEVQYASSDIIDAINAKDIPKAKTALKYMSKATANASKRIKKIKRIPEDATTISHAKGLVEFHKEGIKGIYKDMVGAFDKRGDIINSKVKGYNKASQKLNKGTNTWNGKYQTAKHSLQQRNIPKPKEQFKRS